MADLASISGADRVELLPGLVVEDKLKIKTQRRLEKAFSLPMMKIFPGSMAVPNPIKPGETMIDSWSGVDFAFLDNLIPLLTVLGQQVDDTLTEDGVEALIEDAEIKKLVSGDELVKRLQGYFDRLRGLKPVEETGAEGNASGQES